jgi:predicted nucleotidyltransferase
MLEIQKYSTEISRLCREHKVHKLYAFGSVLTHQFNEKSDIDLIVDFEPLDLLQYADNYYDLKFSLEDVFHRSVDLIEEKAINNPYFQRAVNDKRQLVYEH